MRLFFKKILANFLIVLVLLTLILSYSYSKYFETRVPCIKYNLFHDKINSTDTISLILGSSHSFYGIDSKLLDENTFNFASISQSLMEDYTILKHCKNPIRRVIIPVSYFTNWHYLYKTPIGGEKLRTIDYQTLYGIDYPSFLTAKDIVRFVSELAKNLTKTEKEGFDDLGNVIGKCDSIENEIKDAMVAFDRHNLGKNFNAINPYLDSINLYCALRKIDLGIITMPYSHEYREYTTRAGFDEYLKKLIQKYTKQNCFVFDFRTHFELSDEKIMFRDADHLSFCGRKAFTEFLNDQIKTTSSKSKHQGSN
jgi:hypothetical protein